MLLDVLIGHDDTTPKGFIGGTADGMVTRGGLPASLDIYLLGANNFALLGNYVSMENGHYLITNLDPDQRYLILCRDYHQEYEPAVWDFVAPSTDLSIEEQQALWESWQ